MVLNFHNRSCGYNQHCNRYQETVPLLQSIFTSLFHPYLFTKSSLQSPLTLPSYIIQQFFTSVSLRATIPTIYTKNIFPTSNILPIQAASTDQEVREYWEDWHCFNLSLLPQSMDSECRTHSQSLILYPSDWKIWYIAGAANHPIHLHYTLKLFSLLPYSTNTTTRTHIPLETNCLNLIFILSSVFLYSNHALLHPYV